MKPPDDDTPRLLGRVRTGLGRAAGFTQLDWARARFIECCGIDPHPGTLNLTIHGAEHRRAWAAMRKAPGMPVCPPAGDGCDARLYPVSVGCGGQGITAAVVLPEVSGYPEDQLEIIAAVHLREHFGLVDGQTLDAQLQQPQSVDAVIFDVDGTLLNSLDAYRLAASRATDRYGYTVTDADVRRALNTNQPFWDFVIPTGEPRDEQRIAELRAATMSQFPAALAEVVSVLPGAGAALERLRSAGVRLGIFTGSAGESFAPLRDEGLLELFEVIVTGHDIEHRKPDPQGIAHCVEKLGIDANQAAYVGDSCIDVQASLSAGVMSIAVLSGAGDSASLSAAGAHRLAAAVDGVPDLLELRVSG